MLSILIPSYNYTATSLVNTLHSELTETKLDFEILVLDDCSTDQTTIEANQTIKKLSNCYYHTNSKNLGRTATRQKLAELSKFDYLLFIDADVLPKNENFIECFDVKNQTADLVFGGITYSETPPEKHKILRWTYGKEREAKSLNKRLKKPFISIISGCILVRKNIFLKANTLNSNVYGADVVFVQNIENEKAKILHINNPVIHLGLENNDVFISKTIEGLKTLFELEHAQLINKDYRPIQKARIFLKKYGLIVFYVKIIKILEPTILKNLKSAQPSLFLFDLYRLYIFTKLYRYQTY